jgi:hypothetical protein
MLVVDVDENENNKMNNFNQKVILNKYLNIFIEHKKIIKNEINKIKKIEDMLFKSLKNYYRIIFYSKIKNDNIIIHKNDKKKKDNLEKQKYEILLLNGKKKTIKIFNHNDIKKLFIIMKPKEILNYFLKTFSKVLNIKENISKKYTFKDFLEIHIKLDKIIDKFEKSNKEDEFINYRNIVLTNVSNEIDLNKKFKIFSYIKKKEYNFLIERIKFENIYLKEDLYKEESKELYIFIKNLKEKKNITLNDYSEEEKENILNPIVYLFKKFEENFILLKNDNIQCKIFLIIKDFTNPLRLKSVLLNKNKSNEEKEEELISYIRRNINPTYI